MLSQESVSSNCPYCGENISLLIDCSVPQQQYIEDCQVCCRPIQVEVNIDEDDLPSVVVKSETE